MTDRIIGLSRPSISVPDPIAADSNVVIALFEQYVPGQPRQHVTRAEELFHTLIRTDQRVVLTPTAFSEVLHAVVKNTYEQRVRGHRAAVTREFGVPIDGWKDLCKQDPTPLRLLSRDLTRSQAGLVNYNLVIASPSDLGAAPLPIGYDLGEDLIARMTRYGLDSSDAMITLEASRLGINAIVSMDRDMLRAAVDFDVYTWL